MLQCCGFMLLLIAVAAQVLLTFANPGLLIVDREHRFVRRCRRLKGVFVVDRGADIHFQYNGFLFGLFIFSIALVRKVSQ
jgi:hypothetical protein